MNSLHRRGIEWISVGWSLVGTNWMRSRYKAFYPFLEMSLDVLPWVLHVTFALLAEKLGISTRIHLKSVKRNRSEVEVTYWTVSYSLLLWFLWELLSWLNLNLSGIRPFKSSKSPTGKSVCVCFPLASNSLFDFFTDLCSNSTNILNLFKCLVSLGNGICEQNNPEAW